jgi:hypothetical protein
MQQAYKLKEGDNSSFYMDSYLLDITCSKNVFVGIKLRLNTSELSVHIYFDILWENMYKKSYSFICNEFIACIHFILFNKEYPRVSTTEKKVIENTGHWYAYERDTYIEVFRATRAPHLLPAHVPDWLVI